MPLVRIDLRRGRPAGFASRVGEIVYQAMVETINVPANDNFQVITEHDGEMLVYDPNYLGIARSDGVIFIQITLNEGRTTELKKRFYQTVVEKLQRELAVRPEDVLIGLIEVKKENWSFGNGVAQYAA